MDAAAFDLKIRLRVGWRCWAGRQVTKSEQALAESIEHYSSPEEVQQAVATKAAELQADMDQVVARHRQEIKALQVRRVLERNMRTPLL